ncbi:MAG: hypothetical protein WCJ18_01110, partial [Planctomycetota bacterium]
LTINASGNITQSGDGITTGGAVVLDSGSGGITLTTSTNDFGGAVSATNTGGAAIALRDANAILLGAVSASGALTVTAVGITQTGDGVTAVGNATFSAGAAAITLTDADNDFQGTVALSNSGANDVSITDKNAIQLAASSLGSGTLTVTAVGVTQTGPITQEASAGTATFNSGAGVITLTDAGNDFTGAVAANNSGANAIQITDANALKLGVVTTQNALTVIAGGAVTQSGNVSVAGATSVTATGFDITLDRVGNAFIGAVSLTGLNVEVANGNDLVLGPGIATGTYKASAAGDIDQLDDSPATIAGITSTGLATFTTLTAGKSIRLDNTLNNFAGGVSVGGASLKDVTVYNPLYPLVLDAFTLTGNLAIQAKGITQSGPLTVGGTSSFDGGAGVVTISNANNDFTGAVSAQNTGAFAVTLVDKTAILLGAISTTGALGVTAVGITQNQPLSVTGVATFDGGSGGITLTDAANDFLNTVNLTATGAAGASVTDKNAINLGAVSTGTGTLAITASGAITQTAAGITTGGAVVLGSGSGAITLTDGDNDFGGAVSATNTGGAAIALVDANSIELGAISASGALAVTAVGITQTTDGVTAVGNATFSAGTGVITLTDADNDFQGTVALSSSGANDVAITDKNAIQLAASSVGSGTLTVTAVGITQTGAITQTASAGAATFSGGEGVITLTNAGNDFTGAVAANNTGANAIQITDSNALELGAITTADNLTLNAGGAVTQAASTAIVVTGTTSVTATGSDITLTNTGNDFGGAVSLTGKNVAVYDSTSLLLGPSTATGTYAATANTGDITQEPAPAAGLTVTGTATFTANGSAANILLDNPANSFAGGVSIVAGDANNVTIIDTSKAGLVLATISITGNLTIEADGITQTGAVSVLGLTSLTSTGGNILLTNTGNDFDTVAVNTAGKTAAVSLTDATGITFVASTLGSGTFTVNAASIGQTGAITQDAAAGAVSLTASAGSIVLDDIGNSFTAAVSASTTDGYAISLTNSTAITLGTVTAAPGTAPAGGGITITANGIAATGGANSITTIGGILLQPLSKMTTIGVAGGAGAAQFAQSMFNTAITNGAASITIGRADQSGTITVGAVTFLDPTIIRAPSGSVSVVGQITGFDNASIWIQASPTTVTLSADIVTAGNAITIDDGAGGPTSVILAASVVLDTTGGNTPTGANVTIRGTVTSDLLNFGLTIKGGTDGDVLVTGMIGAVGAGVDLASLTVSGNDVTLADIDGVADEIGVVASDATGSSDDASITLTGTTYRTTGTTSTQYYGSGTTATPRALVLAGGSAGSTATFTLSSNDLTDYIEITGLVDLNGRNMTVDTTNAGAETGSAVIFNNSIDGVGTLAIDAGTTGVVSINAVGGSVGSTTPLTGFTISNADTVNVGGALSAGTVTLTNATTSIQFSDTVSISTALVTAAQPYSLKFLGGTNGTNTISGATTFLNTGALQLGDGGDTFTFADGVVGTAPSAITIAGTIAATTGVITLGDADTTVTVPAGSSATIGGASTGLITLGNVVILEASSLVVGTGVANTIQIGSITGTAGGIGESLTLNTTGAATVTGAIGTDIGKITITQSGGTTFKAAVDATTVTITDTTGTVAFEGMLTADSLLMAPNAYAVSLLGNGSEIQNAVTFSNTGGVTLGDGGDVLTFNGGITSIASGTTLAGTVVTPDVIAAFDGLTLAGNSVINTGTGPGDITIGSITGGTKDLQLISGSGTTTVSGAATGLGTVTLQEDAATSTGAVTFQGDLSATTLTTFARGYSVVFQGAASTITTATKFLNTGAVALGNDPTDVTTFTGGLDTTAGPSGTTVAGTIATTNTAMDLGAVTLASDAVTESGSGGITIASVTAPGLAYGLTFGSPTQTGGVTVTGDITMAVGSLVALSGGFDVSLLGTTNAIGVASLINTGVLQLGDATGDTFSFAGGLTATSQSAVKIAGLIEAKNSAITLGGVTLLAATTLRSGSGTIATGSVTDGAGLFGLTLGGDAFGSEAQTGTITLAGNVTLDGLSTIAGAYGVALTGSSNEITQAVTFNNTSFVTFGDGSGDVTLFTGGVSIPSVTGNTNLIGTIRSAGKAITFDNTKLTGNATIDTTNAGADPNGATITLAGGVLLEGWTLTTIGGSGGSSSTDLVGPTNLTNGTLVVQSGDLNIGTGSGTPAAVTVTQDTTIEVSAGSLNVSANSTIVATGKTLTLLADSITIS